MPGKTPFSKGNDGSATSAPSLKTESEKNKVTRPRPPPEGRLNWRYIGAAHGSYVVFETDTGLVLLNWRGARSRILYEEILAVAGGRAPGRQKLLFPIPLELDAPGAAALQENLEFFRGNGFDIEPFGRNYFRIEALPEWLDPGQGESFARDLLGWLRERGLNPDRPQLAREEIARLASIRMAGAGHPPGREEVMRLAERLMSCQNPLSDPKGRPTFFEISRSELEKKFGK